MLKTRSTTIPPLILTHPVIPEHHEGLTCHVSTILEAHLVLHLTVLVLLFSSDLSIGLRWVMIHDLLDIRRLNFFSSFN
jgi:hypothetical protein